MVRQTHRAIVRISRHDAVDGQSEQSRKVDAMSAITDMGMDVRELGGVEREPEDERQGMVRKVAWSSFLGNFIEWFDYASYSYFATVIAGVFFPSSNRTVALMETFGVFALSFVLRPVGALFWGAFRRQVRAQTGVEPVNPVDVGCLVPHRLPAVLRGHRRARTAPVAADAHGAGFLGIG